MTSQADHLSNYQDIYDWKSKFHTLQSIGENGYGKTGHSKIFIFFVRHFMIIFEAQLF